MPAFPRKNFKIAQQILVFFVHFSLFLHEMLTSHIEMNK